MSRSAREPFRCVAADPPWRFSDKLPGKARGASKHYGCLTFEEIRDYPLPEIADDAWLFLWRVSSMVDEAMAVARAWGFEPTSEVVWVKKTRKGNPHFGMGRSVRLSHEVAIVAKRGRPVRLAANVRSVFEAPVGRHSEKPSVFYSDVVERLAPGPRVELFARARRPGWTTLGLEVEGPREKVLDMSVQPR